MTTDPSTTTQLDDRPNGSLRERWPDWQRASWRTRLATVLAATAAAALLWLVAVPLAGVHLVAPQGPGASGVEEVPFGAVLVSATVAGLAGWLFLALLEAVTRHARLAWTVVATVLLLASLAPVFNPDLPSASRAVLGLLHLAVGIPLIVGMRRRHDDAPPTG